VTAEAFLKLALQSVTDPRDVARLLLTVHPGREALWTAFALVVVLNALIFSASLTIFPPQGPLPFFLGAPTGFIVTQGTALVGMIAAMTWTGRLFGGKGRFGDVALLLIWMQGLRVLVQAALLLITPVSAALSGLIMLAASGIGIWILLNFLDEVHELGGLGRAAMVLVLGFIGLAFGLSLILTMAGVTPEGMMGNV